MYASIKSGLTQEEIVDQLERSPSTISRELKRSSSLRGYRPAHKRNDSVIA